MPKRMGPLQLAAEKLQRLIDADGMTGDIFDPTRIGGKRMTKEQIAELKEQEQHFKNWFRSWYKESLQLLVNANKTKSKRLGKLEE